MAASWLKQGAESEALAKQEAAAAQTRKEEQGKMFRFFLKQGEECQITFIDGELSKEKGILLPPRYYEHNLQLNGKWGNTFVCPTKTAPHLHEFCPICASGDAPSLVSLFTVIDHRTYVSQKGVSYKDTQKLFVAKPGTMEILNKLAVKRGGLAGCTFDVSRNGDKAPAVGTMFDFVQKREIEELRQLFTREIVDPKTNAKSMKCFFVPADYESEITFKSGEELAALGFGSAQSGGYSPSPSPSQGGATTGTTNYADQM